MKRITLHRDTTQGWMADFHDDPEVIAAFGCTVLPTVFTACAAAHVVLAAIRRLNPDCAVSVDPRDWPIAA